MQTLTIALATYNEEENIKKCLDSVKGLADEIIIVDGTSNDRTREIAEEYGAKVIIRENPANFHINKQKAIDLASSEWILQLDADEKVSPELKEEIKEKILRQNPEANGFWIPRKNFFLGRYLMKGGQYPDYTLRLYRRGKGRLPQKDVHEQAEVEGEVAYLKSALLHYPYKNFLSYIRKWNRYNKFEADQLKNRMKGKNFYKKGFLGIVFIFIKPTYWFFLTYFRHKGVLDSWQGFIFSFFSALRYPVTYFRFILF